MPDSVVSFVRALLDNIQLCGMVFFPGLITKHPHDGRVVRKGGGMFESIWAKIFVGIVVQVITGSAMVALGIWAATIRYDMQIGELQKADLAIAKLVEEHVAAGDGGGRHPWTTQQRVTDLETRLQRIERMVDNGHNLRPRGN